VFLSPPAPRSPPAPTSGPTRVPSASFWTPDRSGSPPCSTASWRPRASKSRVRTCGTATSKRRGTTRRLIESATTSARSRTAEPGHHAPLARHRDDRAGAALADHRPRELSSGCDEHGHVVAPGDRQHPIERLLGETARDENQQLALAHRPAAALGEGVVHVDGRVLHPIPLAERPRDKGAEPHQAEIGPPLEPALGEGEHARIEGKEQGPEP